MIKSKLFTCLFICFIVWLPGFKAHAQNSYSITGTIKDKKGETLPGATVFLTNTKYQTATNNAGKFAINEVTPGTYQVVVKMLGFVPYINQVTVDDKLKPLVVTLQEDNILLNAVTVNSTDPNRDKYLKQFIKYFIGESTNAGRCKILNPHVLKFHYDKNTAVLTANADSILKIENNGLGYILNYVLTEFKVDAKNNIFSFMGYPYFEELNGSVSQQTRWEKNRKDSYLGSASHFFRSVYNNTAATEGFFLYALTKQSAHQFSYLAKPIATDSVFTPIDDNFNILNQRYNKHTANDSTALYVFYRKKRESYQFFSSGLNIPSPVSLPVEGQLSSLQPIADTILIDKNGSLTPRKSFFISGYWAWEKVAELLPLDYHSGEVANRLNRTVIAGTQAVSNGLMKNNQPADSVEKAYLHLDRSYYAAGDTIWFKAYVVMGSKHELSPVSKVLSVDLIDNRDSIKKSIKLSLKDGLAQGDFDLPFTLESGNYRIRAYTNWMRNLGDDHFFDQRITIINPAIISNIKITPGKAAIVKALPVKPAIPNVDIRFFPEGSNFVIGVPSKIAFKATSETGLGTAIKGVVTDEQGNTVTSFESGKLGMGIFTLTAEIGKAYSAKIKLTDSLTDSSVRVVQLPKAVNTGYILNVNSAGPDHIRVIAQKASNTIGTPVILIAKSGGVIYYEGKSKPGSNTFITTFAKNTFPTGVVQFTLFSAQGEPLNERLVFIQNNDELKIDIAAEKQIYSPQQKVKLSFSTKSGDEMPVHGNFSISVIDETKVPADDNNENNILSNLLLTSDLKGYIENPGYYFAFEDQKTADDLDALMLTQGYRSFVWKATGTAYQAEIGLDIAGYLKTNSGKPIANGKVTLFATGGTFFAQDTTADSKGHFVFKNLVFNDSTKFMLQGATEKERNNLQISLDKPGTPKITKSNIITELPTSDNVINTKELAPFIATSKTKYAIQQKYHLNDNSKLLKEVTIKESTKQVLKHTDNLGGPDNHDYVFTAKDIASFKCGFLTTCLEGRIPGMGLSNSGANSFLYLSKVAGMNFGHPVPMLVLIDGTPGNMDLLPPNAIESIEFLTTMGTTAVYGGKGNAGMIIITTKRGPDEIDVTTPSPGTITFKEKGLEKVREFYSPRYDNPKTNTQLADLRTTIFWNPNVETGKTAEATFEYFNAGSKGTYRVVVEGIDYATGSLGRQVYHYKVE